MKGFYFQGAVPLSSNAYIERPFEKEIIRSINARNWVLLLGPRQHGKTTSLIRIAEKIRHDIGYIVSLVDLQSIPTRHSYEEFLERFATKIGQSLGIHEVTQPARNNLDDLNAWLVGCIPQGFVPIVIIIDEASAISNFEWRNNFYSQIRAIKNQRAIASEGDLASRLHFIFAGSFRPETLVDTQNSPFNVCERIELSDLRLEDTFALVEKVDNEIDRNYVEHAYEFVGGQPFLLQYFFSKIASAEPGVEDEVFTRVVKEMTTGNIDHLNSVFGPILSDNRLVELVAAMAEKGSILNEPANTDHRYLQVLGVAKREGPNLVFRNKLYQVIAENCPQMVNVPKRPGVTVLIETEIDVYRFMRSQELREFAYSMEIGAIRAHNNENFRLALIGFGSAAEAILLDWLCNVPQDKLIQAVLTAQSDPKNQLRFAKNFEMVEDPHTWRLINLLKVARCLVGLDPNNNPTDALREWRNLVHPGKAIENYMQEKMFGPESLQACGFLAAIRRDIEINS